MCECLIVECWFIFSVCSVQDPFPFTQTTRIHFIFAPSIFRYYFFSSSACAACTSCIHILQNSIFSIRLMPFYFPSKWHICSWYVCIRVHVHVCNVHVNCTFNLVLVNGFIIIIIPALLCLLLFGHRRNSRREQYKTNEMCIFLIFPDAFTMLPNHQQQEEKKK